MRGPEGDRGMATEELLNASYERAHGWGCCQSEKWRVIGGIRETVSLVLTDSCYGWLRRAAANQRQLDRIMWQMRKLSRQTLFKTVPRGPTPKVIEPQILRAYLMAIRVKAPLLSAEKCRKVQLDNYRMFAID